MCCMFAILVFLGPRIAGIIWWLAAPLRWQAAFNGSWLWPVLGLIFLPWTTLMWVIVAPTGQILQPISWLWIALGVLADISSYSGSAYGNRSKLGYGR
jgi:hypothetical protein